MKQNIYDNDIFFQGYQQLRAKESGLNAALEEPARYALLPALSGLDILDLGCGTGKFCRLAAATAATVTGADISQKMLQEAIRQTKAANVTYICAPAEELTFAQQRFNLVVSSLALHYIANYQQVVTNVFQWLQPGGQFIFSVEHPMCTAMHHAQWQTDEAGNILHWPVDNYQEETIRHTTWFVENVIKYHRTTATYVNTLIQAGFRITGLHEPLPVKEYLEQRPSLARECRRPPFLLLAATKPSI